MNIYNIASVVTVLLLGLSLVLGVVGFWLASFGLFPQFVRQSRECYARPVTTFLVGLLGVIPVALGIMIANASFPLIKLAGIAIGASGVVLALCGSAGLALRIGDGLTSQADEGQPWRRVLRGSTVLACTMLIPLFGWMVVTTVVVISGFGAGLKALFGVRRARRKQRSLENVVADGSRGEPAPIQAENPPPVVATAAPAPAAIATGNVVS